VTPEKGILRARASKDALLKRAQADRFDLNKYFPWRHRRFGDACQHYLVRARHDSLPHGLSPRAAMGDSERQCLSATSLK
jgi:hypothetical protein